MAVVDDNLVTIDVTGMTCAACSARVERVLRGLPGVRGANVSLPLERADVTLETGQDAAPLLAAIEDAGYHAFVRGKSAGERRAQRLQRAAEKAAERRRTRWLAGLAVLLAAPFMVDMARMLWGASDHWLDPWVQAGLATIAQIVCGWRFYRGAWAALRNGFANMDVLVALGTSAAYGLSLFNLLSGRAHHGGGLYFEAGVTVLAFLLIGKVLEGEAKSGASAALEALAAGMPRLALKIVGGLEAEVEAGQLVPGDRVAVRPGAQVPADGRIVEGHAAFDEALITGESMPVAKGAGDAVIAGSVAAGGRVIVEVVATGEDTRLSRIARLIEDAEIARSPIQQMADRVSAVFVPAVMLVALAAFGAWLWSGAGLEQALLIAVAVLVVACPCALGLATPIALVAGANAAARAGLIITDHAALEAAGRVTRVAFDKTGTLTIGKPAVAGIAAANPMAALVLAAALASRSDHPLDRALVGAASDEGLALPGVTAFAATPGRGVTGVIDGRQVAMGNAEHLAAQGVDGAAASALLADPALALAGSVALLSVDGVAHAAFGFADQPRDEVPAAIAALHRQGITVTVLSGDRQAAVDAFARQTGLDDARGALQPEDKIRAIAAMREGGGVIALVGDGINDAPALRAADLGIAMGSGTDAAKAAAAVTLARPDPRLVPAMIEAGRATRRTIQQNLAFAFLFNGIGIPLAALGKLSPAIAGAAMAASSVSVVLNAWWLARRRF
jgi:Cu+-exporting ATPase